MDIDDILRRLLDAADEAESELRYDLAELLRGAALHMQHLRNKAETDVAREDGSTRVA